MKGSTVVLLNITSALVVITALGKHGETLALVCFILLFASLSLSLISKD